MAEEYQNHRATEPGGGETRGGEPREKSPRIAIRRESDRCFHAVEEVLPEGYIIGGVLILRCEVVDRIELLPDGTPKPAGSNSAGGDHA